MKEAAEFREVKLKGKNHILKTGHYRLKNELKSDHKKVEQLQEQVLLKLHTPQNLPCFAGVSLLPNTPVSPLLATLFS